MLAASGVVAGSPLLLVLAAGLAEPLVAATGLAPRQSQVAATLVLQGGFGVLGYVAWRRLGPEPAAAAWSEFARGLPFGAVVALVELLVNRLVVVAATMVGHGEPVAGALLLEARRQRALLLQLPAPWWVLGAAIVLVVAPVAEELFFRGYVHRYLVRVVSLPAWPAAALSAFSFALVHGFVAHLPGLWATGLVLALWYSRRGHIGAAIGAHVAANALGLLALLALGGQPVPS
ncbi:MAG: CPBP family intramembrane metalloprotease [Limnochordaceae bacterium]|nr:CPBP family intramembrane metalloprotease [Limnochordaceae bacterium]